MVLDSPIRVRGANGVQSLMEPRFLDALGVAVYTTDAAGVITQFNNAAVELWGRVPQIGKDQWCGSWRLFFPDGRPMAHDECPMGVTLKENRAVRGQEAIAERPDGTRIWFIPYPTPLHDEAGQLVGAVNVLVDITDRTRAEEAALYLNAIITSSDDAIVSKDLDGTVTSWNQGAERLFGFTGDEILGRSIRMIIPADRQTEEDQVLARVRGGEPVEHFETVRRRKDGVEVPISLTVSPVRDRSGRIIGASKIARDISERKEADRALAEALAVKDEFMGYVAHELKTPLTTVFGNAAMLARAADRLDMQQIISSAREIQRDSARLNAIVDDLLSLARLERGEIELEPTLLARAVQTFLKDYPPKSNRRIDLQIHDDDILVMGDERVVHHVLTNYLSNAAKYSPSDSIIEVVVDKTEREGRLRVLDRGIGVEADETERVFDSFYRSKNVGEVAGIGIGLSACRRLARTIGGRCWAERREGGGSEFGFSLPLDFDAIYSN